MNEKNTVLLVEDNIADVKLTKLSYESQDISVEILHCADGKIALDTLQSLSIDNLGYVLLDLNMPRLNGLELLKICKEDATLRKLPIIIFTTSANRKDIQKCYELGANAYVQKPVDLTEFDQAVRAIDGFWGEINVNI